MLVKLKIKTFTISKFAHLNQYHAFVVKFYELL